MTVNFYVTPIRSAPAKPREAASSLPAQRVRSPAGSSRRRRAGLPKFSGRAVPLATGLCGNLPPDQRQGPLLYLGTHMTSWLASPAAPFPLMVSYHRLTPLLARNSPLMPATCRWVLDSGAFTELAMRGRWTIPPERYVANVARCQREIGLLDWAAPQDLPCEPQVIASTGLSVEVHQHLTVYNFIHLLELWRQESDRPCPFIPVVQGWTIASYEYCIGLYAAAGINLATWPLTGVGSVCRRQGTIRTGLIVSHLASAGLRLHAFGVKTTGVAAYGGLLSSFDTLAWSFAARRSQPMPGHNHRSCSNCLVYATAWRERLLSRLESVSAASSDPGQAA